MAEKVLHFFNNEKGDIVRNNNRELKEFEWLFLDGYFKGALYAIAEESETEEIIGTYAGLLIPMVSPAGEKIITMKGEDTLISFDRMINYGKRDILVEMSNFLEQGAVRENVSFIWGFSPSRAAFKRCGFNISAPVKGSFLVLKPLKFYSLRLKIIATASIKRKALLISFAITNYFVQSIANFRGVYFSCCKVKFDDINFNKINEFLPVNVYSLLLDRELLKWRIERNPSGVKYGFLEFRNKKGDNIAYLIYSENADRVIYVEQLLFHKSLSAKEKTGVINSAKRFLRKQKAVMLRAMGFSHNPINVEEMRLLKQTGFHFFSNQEPSYFLFKNINGSSVIMEDIYVSRLNSQGVV